MVTKYVQENGLRVILEPVDNVASISAGLWLTRGSRDEMEEQYGYAHFVEHMLFKGTEKYTAQELARIVDRVGGQHNAATNREYTCYYINVIFEHLEMAVEILADMYFGSLLDPVELEKEKNVIIEEIKMYEDTPDEFIHDLFMENMLIGHPLSHSILGTVESIGATTSEKLRKFYNHHYRNENAVFVIAGNFETDHARKLIDTYFKKGAAKGDVSKLSAPSSPERLYLKHCERDLEQVHFCMGAEGLKRADDDRWGLYILSTILGGSMSSRLFQKIREDEGLSYSVYTFHSSFSDTGIFGIYCATAPENYRRAVELTMEECRKILKNGVSSEELQDAKTFMKGNLALSFESMEVRMGQLAKNEMTFERQFGFEEIIRLIDRVTMDDFNRTASRLFTDITFSLVSLGRKPKWKYKDLDLHI
ncbi:MAG: peptidase M16 [Spirochaetae bacterium HGW-Spirochaetae-1]|jgi:predicted Zn-dependent peptidase|nr:MAG: peptidase M16 [Spirochaetae bacterium HGW-Spirochaetae-1]